jgi:hypothetical protein
VALASTMLIPRSFARASAMTNLKFRLERTKWLKKEAQSLDFQFGATKELPRPVPGEMFCFLRLKNRS